MKHSTSLPRVLIVDDEPLARDTLEALLYLEGYQLLFATNGIDALQRMKELAPDVILLDVMMPQMTGFEVCQYLKKRGEFRHIPIILVTALDGSEELVRGLDAGADEFITKPVNSQELRARVRSMLRIKAQYDELAQTMHLREFLSNMIVHDMRNPLAAILLYIQLVKRKNNLIPEQAKYFDLIHTEAQQLSTFLDDILMLAKMEKGKLILTRSAVDMGKLVTELEQKYITLTASQSVKFVLIHTTDRAPTLTLDVGLFQRVLDNLISNALKFSQQDSKITLSIEYPRQANAQAIAPLLRIQVMDEGPGIRPEDRERIFDKYEIVTMKQTGQSQLGLGLAFCRMVVEAHGGRIFADNNTTKGAVLTIEI
jgi:two-component system sensor histidine kinase/response regulator